MSKKNHCCDIADPFVGAKTPEYVKGQKVCHSGEFQIGNQDDQVNVVVDNVDLILPDAPRKGLGIVLTTTADNTRLFGGCNPICGAEDVDVEDDDDEDEDEEDCDCHDDENEDDDSVLLAKCTATIAYFNGCEWVLLTSAGVLSGLQGAVDDAAALVALNCDDLPNLTRILVRTYDQYFELDKTSTAVPDGVTVFAASCGGNWLRIETFSKKWSEQLVWYQHDVLGNDENDGATPATPTLALAEIGRRLHQTKIGKDYQINVLNNVAASDRFRTYVTAEQNVEDVEPTTVAGATAGVSSSIPNFSIVGRLFDSGISSTMTNYVTTSSTNPEPADGNQAHFTDAAFPGVVGDLIVLSAPGNPAIDGGQGFVGLVGNGANGLGVGLVRVTDLTLPTDPANTVVASFAGPVTYKIVRLSQWNANLAQSHPAQGRYFYKNFEFTAVPPPPADQQDFSIAGTGAIYTFFTSRFRRYIFQGVLATITYRQCSFDYAGLTATGTPYAGVANDVGGTTFVVLAFAASVVNFQRVLMLNADLRICFNSMSFMQGLYLQGSRIASSGTNSGLILGSASAATLIQSAAKITHIGNTTIYNWPTASQAGYVIADGTQVRLNANLGGRSSNAGSVGVLVKGPSELMILATVTPSINTNTVGVAEIRIDNPGGTQDLAVRAGTGALAPGSAPTFITAAGPVIHDAETLVTWATWAGVGANEFGRFAFNPLTGSRVESVTNPN
jgi:hypothetical protein